MCESIWFFFFEKTTDRTGVEKKQLDCDELKSVYFVFILYIILDCDIYRFYHSRNDVLFCCIMLIVQ